MYFAYRNEIGEAVLVGPHAATLPGELPVQVQAVKVVCAEEADGGLHEYCAVLRLGNHADESGDSRGIFFIYYRYIYKIYKQVAF